MNKIQQPQDMSFGPDLTDGEGFPEAKALMDESFDEEEFRDPGEVEANLRQFWKLDSPKQRKYAKNITRIIDTLKTVKLPFIVESLYPSSRALMESNVEIAYILTDAIQIFFTAIDHCEVLKSDENAIYKIEVIFLDFLKEIIEILFQVIYHYIHNKWNHLHCLLVNVTEMFY